MGQVIDKGTVKLLETGERYVVVPVEYLKRAIETLSGHIADVYQDVDLEVSKITSKGRELLAIRSLDSDFYMGIGENSLLWNLDEPIPNMLANIQAPESFLGKLFRRNSGVASGSSFMPSNIPNIFELAEKPSRVAFFNESSPSSVSAPRPAASSNDIGSPP